MSEMSVGVPVDLETTVDPRTPSTLEERTGTPTVVGHSIH